MRPRSSPPRVYIGHCEADESAAMRLAMALRDEHGLEEWLTDWAVRLGEVIVTKQEQAITGAEAAPLVFLDRRRRSLRRRGGIERSQIEHRGRGAARMRDDVGRATV